MHGCKHSQKRAHRKENETNKGHKSERNRKVGTKSFFSFSSSISKVLSPFSCDFLLDNHSDQDLFQSDMRLTPTQRLLAETGGDVSQAKQLEGNTFGSAKDIGILWYPQRVVPYTITKQLGRKFTLLVYS